MKNDEIIKKLQLFKNVSPDAAFSARLKKDIFEYTPKSSFAVLVHTQWFKTGAFSLAGAAVAIIVTTLIFFAPTRNPAIASLENAQLTKELNGFSINIQLQEITYHNNADRVIASAINEIRNTETRHLNTSILKEEQGVFGDIKTKNVEIDALLNTLTN